MVLLPSKVQKSIKKKYAGKKKGKLLFFTSDYKIGQSSLLTDQLMALYKSELDFVAVSGENEQEVGLKERIEDIGIDVRRIEGLDVHANFMGLARQIADIISKEDIRCVHVQNNWQILLVVFVKFILQRRFGLKIVYTLHGFRHNSPVKSVIARIIIGAVLLLFANRVICMSTYLKRKFYFLGKKAVLIPLGISDEYFLPEHPLLPENGLQMVFPAQFRYGKNQDMIIRAFARHIHKNGDTESHLYLPGMGELSEEMKELTKNLGIADRVSFPGFCSKQEVLQLYLKCNIGIVASNSETFGQSIVEPFVLGRCVVSTHVGIADDILVDGENGYFFASEDELVDVFERLYRNQALIGKAGNINYSKRQMFAWDNVTERYVELINSL
ncbi:MAG: glycosyltransferase family 4 protein [Alistipes sp.]|nr:glycosyltransferase family 4 protein [Alistipes sp.]